ncbi:hypothetical protein BDV11DRAFT_199336 [Aspergillus similis]
MAPEYVSNYPWLSLILLVWHPEARSHYNHSFSDPVPVAAALKVASSAQTVAFQRIHLKSEISFILKCQLLHSLRNLSFMPFS